jgi:hypothetical protein
MLYVWKLNNITTTTTIIILHAPWSRVLPEKLTGFQLVKKFTPF